MISNIQYRIPLLDEELDDFYDQIIDQPSNASLWLNQKTGLELETCNLLVNALRPEPDYALDALIPSDMIDEYIIEGAHFNLSQPYAFLLVDHFSKQLDVIRSDGTFFKINQQHPEWNAVTQFFYQQSFSDVEILLNADRFIAIARFINQGTKFTKNKNQSSDLFSKQTARTIVGVEQPKSISFKLVFIILILIIVSMLYYFK